MTNGLFVYRYQIEHNVHKYPTFEVLVDVLDQIAADSEGQTGHHLDRDASSYAELKSFYGR